jgi:chemotaxis protein methyltransferase CheR
LETPGFADWQIDIIGTDISQRVLQVARRGVYGNSSFRSTDPVFQQRYFTEVDGKFRIADRVKSLVTISHLNLFDPARVVLLGKMDVIFCRNVIIYFDLPAKKRVIENFHERLRPEGFLLLGHSESLMSVTNAFMLRHFAHDMVYQRPALATAGGEIRS